MALGDGTRIDGTSSFDSPTGSKRYSLSPMDNDLQAVKNERRMDRLRDRALKKAMRKGDLRAISLYQDLKKDPSYKNNEGIQNSLELQDLDQAVVERQRAAGMRAAGFSSDQEGANDLAARAEKAVPSKQVPQVAPTENVLPDEEPNLDFSSAESTTSTAPLKETKAVQRTRALAKSFGGPQLTPDEVKSKYGFQKEEDPFDAVVNPPTEDPYKAGIDAAKGLSEAAAIAKNDLPDWQKAQIANDTASEMGRRSLVEEDSMNQARDRKSVV